MFVYSPLGKQTEKQVVVIKSLGPSNKLKQIPQDLMNDLIRSKLKGTVELQDIIKKDDQNYKSKRGKTYNFSKQSLPAVFLIEIYKGHLSIEKANIKQSNFVNELKNFDDGIQIFLFLNNLELLFNVREKVFNSFKSRLFLIKNLDKNARREPPAEPTQ